MASRDSPLMTVAGLRRLVLACTATALLVVGVSVVALIVTYGITSDARIAAHLRDAVQRGVLTSNPYPVSQFGHYGHNYDMQTECMALGMNLTNAESGLLRRIAASQTVWVPRAQTTGNACGNLVGGLQSHTLKTEEPYARYWHGYQIYSRPLLSVMSLGAYRRITAALLYGSLIFLALRLAQTFGPWAWPVTLLPFFLIGDMFTVPFVATAHALSLAWGFFSVGIAHMLISHDPELRDLTLPLWCFTAGMIANYLSYIINTPLAPALIGSLVIAHEVTRANRPLSNSVVYAFGLIASWYAGYFIEWISKWVFAALVLGFHEAAGEVMNRFSLYAHEGDQMAIRILDATKSNYWNAGGRLLLTCFGASVAAVAIGLATGRVSLKDAIGFAAMLLPLSTIVLWYELTSSLSRIHAPFASRSLLLFFVVPMLGAILVWRLLRGRSERS